MKINFNKNKSIKQGLVVPNILFTAAYLLFSADVCTRMPNYKLSSYSTNAPLLSLAAKPVDPLDTIEGLSEFEVNPYWLALYRTTRSPLSISVSTPSSKLAPEKVATGEIARAKVPVAVAPLGEEEGIEGVVKEPTEGAVEELAVSKSNNIKITPINYRRKRMISLKPVFTECFGEHATLSSSLSALDVPTDNRSLDQPIENNAIKDPQEEKRIKEMEDMVSNCENYLTEN
ncbi:hypothetical protein [Candidatus Cardinium hertigii]|uniref:hypothetical protein n=1 Tax=Candidatus Cardinium hertigii TaxID=247481 RepID=UPI003D7DC665